MYENQNSENELTMPFLTDEDFVRLTNGLRKEDIHPLLVNMRQVGPVNFSVTNDQGLDVPVRLIPGNMENGALLPELAIETEEARTILTSFPGEKCTAKVEPFKSGVSLDASLSTVTGIEVQSETDFHLIPTTHWRALNYAKAGIERDNSVGQPSPKTKKVGRLLGWLGKH
jgi:hypothetical protein